MNPWLYVPFADSASEGSSRRPYILGLARAALAAGWDVLA